MSNLDTFKQRLSETALRYESASAGARDEDELKQLRIKSLGKKGELTRLLKELGSIDRADRPEAGREANLAKKRIEKALEKASESLTKAAGEEELKGPQIDRTLPGRRHPVASLHPLSRVMYELVDIFSSLGFEVAEGPDIEDDYHNFKALNFPDDHPARDMQDTLFMDEAGSMMLRTHTSPVQIRTMKKQDPPVKIVAPGAVYRRDDDITHSPIFYQLEGLLVDEGISFAHLKGVLGLFAKTFFGPEMEVRFRPSFFPFTEPSAEMDGKCFKCGGKGCRVCSQTGWIEIMGAGMVHANVLEEVGYDSEKYTGFAFGMGIDRLAMLRYSIDNIRLLYENDLRFLSQFQQGQ